MKLNRVYIQHTANEKNLYLSNQFFTQIRHITITTKRGYVGSKSIGYVGSKSMQ